MPKSMYKRRRKGYKKFTGRKRFARKYRPRGKLGRRGNKISRASAGLVNKDTLYVKFKYHGWISVSGAANPLNQAFRGNGPWDPVVDTGGQYPPGFKAYGGFFERYTCLGSSCKATFDNANGVPVILAVIPSLYDTLADSDEIDSIRNVKYKICGRDGSAKSLGSVKNYMSTHKMFGISKAEVLDYTGFTGIISATDASNGLPTAVSRWNWIVRLRTAAGTPESPLTLTGTVNIVLTYYCLLRKANSIFPGPLTDVGDAEHNSPNIGTKGTGAAIE